MQAKGVIWSRMLWILTAKSWFCVPYMWCRLGFEEKTNSATCHCVIGWDHLEMTWILQSCPIKPELAIKSRDIQFIGPA